MRKKVLNKITVASILTGFMLFGWGSPSLVTALKEENQALQAKVEAIDKKVEAIEKEVESAKKMMEGLSKAVSELNDDLYKVCQLERKMIALGFSPEYKQLHSLVTAIVKKRGYKIRDQEQ